MVNPCVCATRCRCMSRWAAKGTSIPAPRRQYPVLLRLPHGHPLTLTIELLNKRVAMLRGSHRQRIKGWLQKTSLLI